MIISYIVLQIFRVMRYEYRVNVSKFTFLVITSLCESY